MQLKICKAIREDNGGALFEILLKNFGPMLLRNAKTGGCRKS